jgi:23S rRNA pseudouridine1911/1915/1917 synthase
VVFDDGDLHVIDKPAGLPVLPAGGYLEHTLLRLLELRHRGEPGGVPRPVHRLGRFTSGLLVCARRPATRAWLSAALRESTAVAGGGGAPPCRKLYRTLVASGRLPLRSGESLTITTPIGQLPHPLTGRLWCAVAHAPPGLPARSRLTLIETGTAGDLLEVEISTGRPHQIRIHCAAAGAPLQGDPLYRQGGGARPDARPGEGGYRLHAQRLRLHRPDGEALLLETAMPSFVAQARMGPSAAAP